MVIHYGKRAFNAPTVSRVLQILDLQKSPKSRTSTLSISAFHFDVWKQLAWRWDPTRFTERVSFIDSRSVRYSFVQYSVSCFCRVHMIYKLVELWRRWITLSPPVNNRSIADDEIMNKWLKWLGTIRHYVQASDDIICSTSSRHGTALPAHCAWMCLTSAQPLFESWTKRFVGPDQTNWNMFSSSHVLEGGVREMRPVVSLRPTAKGCRPTPSFWLPLKVLSFSHPNCLYQ